MAGNVPPHKLGGAQIAAARAYSSNPNQRRPGAQHDTDLADDFQGLSVADERRASRTGRASQASPLNDFTPPGTPRNTVARKAVGGGSSIGGRGSQDSDRSNGRGVDAGSVRSNQRSAAPSLPPLSFGSSFDRTAQPTPVQKSTLVPLAGTDPRTGRIGRGRDSPGVSKLDSGVDSQLGKERGYLVKDAKQPVDLQGIVDLKNSEDTTLHERWAPGQSINQTKPCKARSVLILDI